MSTSTEERAQEKRAECPTPAGSNKPESFDALRRLSKLYPDEIERILTSPAADEWSSHMFGKMNAVMDRHGWTCIADVAEFLDRWKPDKAESEARPPKPGERVDQFTDLTEGLGELKQFCPEAVEKADKELSEFWVKVFDKIEHTTKTKGFRMLADVFELMHNWQPPEARAEIPADDTAEATVDLADIRKRVLRVAGLTQAAVLVEASMTNSGPGNVYGDPEDYFSAVVGTIRAANGALDDLLELLDDTVQ